MLTRTSIRVSSVFPHIQLQWMAPFMGLNSCPDLILFVSKPGKLFRNITYLQAAWRNHVCRSLGKLDVTADHPLIVVYY